jgi:single-strand DNA-binding protein
MTDTITLTGLVATQPKHLVTSEGLSITSFRLASTQRRFDRTQERWIDGETNWYTITTFRQLAINVVGSVHKGDRVIATGRLRIRDWTTGEKAGVTIEVDADAVGPDLLWGTAVFSRSISTAVAETAPAAAPNADDPDGDDADGDDPAADAAADDDAATEDDETADEDASERSTGESLDALSVPF